MIYAAVGSRDYPRLDLVERWVAAMLTPRDTLRSGDAAGVDTAAQDAARRAGATVVAIAPDYASYPPRERWKAPLARNTEIVREAEVVIGWWDEASTGTCDALDKALRLKREVLIFGADGLELGHALYRVMSASARRTKARRPSSPGSQPTKGTP